MSGIRSRRKGRSGELEFAKLIRGERVPLSGAAGGSYTDDVVGAGLRWEVKRRKAGFKFFYDNCPKDGGLGFRDDNHGWMVAMPLHVFLAGWVPPVGLNRGEE